MNSCYASIECSLNTELKGKPMAVGGNEASRHGIILAKSEEAKKFGVKTGEPLWQARQKCPDLIIGEPIPYEVLIEGVAPASMSHQALYSHLSRIVFEHICALYEGAEEQDG